MSESKSIRVRRPLELSFGALVAGAATLVAIGCASSSPSATTTAADAGVAPQPDTDSGTSTSGSDPGTDDPAAAYNTLHIPEAVEGKTFALRLATSSKALKTGAKTTTYGYNGANFWGPTLIMNKGDDVQLNVTNALTQDTTTHWHGFHIPAVMDGGPHQVIAAGTTWSPFFKVMNNAGTYWYHPHLHEATQAQLARGAGGFIIVRDPQEAALALPRTYGVDDLPLVLSSRRYLASNEFDLTAVYGDEMLVNGTARPKTTLPSQLVRLRILNAESERAYNLGFADGRTFYLIATDGGLVNTPVAMTKKKLYVGERVEILVDLSGDAIGSAVTLKSFNAGQTFGFPGGEAAQSGTFGSALNNKDFDVLRIEVGARTSGAITTRPTTLASNTYWSAADATNARTITITDNGPGTPFKFDSKAYDATRIDHTVALNTVEKWTITNNRTFDHSFHIHDVQFAIVSRTDGPVTDDEKGWKDTIRIPLGQSVSFVAKFDDFASATNPFMYHCHMSNHEDEGLMGQFLVQ